VRDDLGDLYHASYRRLVAQVYAFTTDLSEAQDAVQEAFARALARRHELADVDAPEAWLRTVAVNIVRRRWRRKQLLNTILLRERPLTRVLTDAPSPERADLRDALAAIPRTYREVIVLHYLADLPVDEVAAILEVPVGTVKSRLSRGREALKGLLDDVEAPPITEVRARAGQIRTRRQVTQALAVLGVLLIGVVWFLPRGTGLPPAVPPSPTPPVYTAYGVTVNGIFDVGTAPDIPGDITSVSLSGQEGWLTTSSGVKAYSDDYGQTWEIGSFSPPSPHPWPGIAGTQIWAAPRSTPGGLWWIMGSAGVFSTRTPSDVDSWVSASVVPGITAGLWGENLLVVTGNGYFKASLSGTMIGLSDGGGMIVDGEPIVLPDDRVLIASGSDWYVSSDYGSTWELLGKHMPSVGLLRATGTGYVALQLFAGWVATSQDGVTWQKLPVH
jgi:RNA polymerase sigma-70 factor (sigma-E family)